MKARRTHLAVCLAVAFYATSLLAAPHDEGEELLRAGKAQQAYQLLQQAEAANAGNVDFDYALGRAALAAGEPAKATLVFERLLVVDPNHAGARLDMGRAYFALGDFERARAEFEAVKALDPPPAARATIDQYQAAIDNRLSPTRTRASAYVEAGFGHDSNVTVGPRNSSIFLPVFGLSFSLSGNARAKSDNYHQLAAGGEVTHAVDENTSLFAGADLKFRNYNQIDPYDQLSGEVRGGVQWNRNGDTWRAFASFNDLRLGDERYREISSLGGDWRHTLSPRDQLAVFAQYSGIRHVASNLQGIDYDQTVLGASWTRLPALNGKLTLLGSVFAGGEQELHYRSDGNKVFGGLRAGFSYALQSDVDLFGGGGWQIGRYDRTNALYNEKRRDQQFDLILGAQWRFSPGWSLRPQLSYTRNDSNIKINAYDRTEAGVFVRKDF